MTVYRHCIQSEPFWKRKMGTISVSRCGGVILRKLILQVIKSDGTEYKWTPRFNFKNQASFFFFIPPSMSEFCTTFKYILNLLQGTTTKEIMNIFLWKPQRKSGVRQTLNILGYITEQRGRQKPKKPNWIKKYSEACLRINSPSIIIHFDWIWRERDTDRQIEKNMK